MSRILGMALVGVIAAGSATGCGPGNNPGDTVDTDASDMGTAPCVDGFTPADPEAGASTCYRAMTCDNSRFCPAVVQNNPMRPILRITQLDPRQPATLATPALRLVLNPAIAGGRFGWGFVFDLAAMTVRTGALQPGVMPMQGTGLLGSTFQFYSGNAIVGDAGTGTATRWDPIMGAITVSGSTINSMPLGQVTVPAFDEMTGALVTELPIRNARLVNMRLSADRNCVGLARGTFNSCNPSAWEMRDEMMMPYGTIEGDISEADARAITVTGAGPLYNIIVGGAACAMDPSGATCTRPDVTLPGSMVPNAWHIVADFTAVSANIQGQ